MATEVFLSGIMIAEAIMGEGVALEESKQSALMVLVVVFILYDLIRLVRNA